MGSIGKGIREDNQFSLNNPASYSALKFAKFEYGSSLDLVRQSTATQEHEYSSGRFNYLFIGVPLSEKKNRGFVFGMLLTPPDVISQSLLAIPMWMLFEVGVFFGRFVLKRRLETDDTP